MKKISPLLFCLITSISFANTRIDRSCVGDVAQFAPIKEYIAVERVIDNNSGLVESFNLSTTFTSFEYCQNYINTADIMIPSKIKNEVAAELYAPQVKCYATSSSTSTFYLVSEQREVGTGLVIVLDKINEFDSLKACTSYL